MAMASANAIAKIAIVWIFEAASGFLPIASTDLSADPTNGYGWGDRAYSDSAGSSEHSYNIIFMVQYN